MSTSRNCRDCGAPLIGSGALEGRCPKCLLDLAADEGQIGLSQSSEGITPPSCLTTPVPFAPLWSLVAATAFCAFSVDWRHIPRYSPTVVSRRFTRLFLKR